MQEKNSLSAAKAQPPEPFVYAPPQEPYLSILHQDEDLLVLDKPSGLLSVPGRKAEHKDSLMLRVQRVFPTATIIHRLDMDTSGILIMPLNRPTMSQLARNFQERTVRKVYTAWIEGVIQSDGGLIDQPLICDWPNRPRQMICYENGKPSQTLWRVKERCQNRTLVELFPISGRSHQLRVHLLHLGHPILGDEIYASPQAKKAATRLQLHASTLELTHPTTGEWLRFDSPAQQALEFF